MSEREKPTIVEVTEQIREQSRQILDRSQDLIRVSPEGIKALVPQLEAIKAEIDQAPTFKPSPLPLDQELGLKLFFNVVNFCFKDPRTREEYTYQRGGETIKRSTGLFLAMQDASLDWNDLAEVSNMTDHHWRWIAQLDDNPRFYLGEERGWRIKSLAQALRWWEGDATVRNFLEARDYDAGKIVTALSESGFFTDEFHKRSQLFVNMAHQTLSQIGGGIKDADKLTAMADYRLAQLFYNTGATKLNLELEFKLRKQIPLHRQSREVQALRASDIEVIRQAAQKMGISEGEGDTLAWVLAQKLDKAGLLPVPHMLVVTDEY